MITIHSPALYTYIIETILYLVTLLFAIISFALILELNSAVRLINFS